MEAGKIGYMKDKMARFRLLTGVSWSESFSTFELYKKYFQKESEYLNSFDKETNWRYKEHIARFNRLRHYRLLIKYFRHNRNILKRLKFLFPYLNELGFNYTLKSLYRVISV